ncbi:MAG TPA: hypothetical protein VM327_01495 [Candidatus Thermoplasmatota archaeon]|nr:hypothetical protein [Candidatus Thermoplasmatota archaeon]
MNTNLTRFSACLALAAMTLLGSAPTVTALPVVDADLDQHVGVHDGGLHVEVSVDVTLGDGSSPPLYDDTVGTGPLFVPVACTGTCTVTASSVPGYVPPVLLIQSGSDVVWESTDVGHVQRETSTPVGSPGACFSVSSPGGGSSVPVTFEIVGGALSATVGGIAKTCANAATADGGAFLVPYHCTIHPTMRGFVAVVA